MFATVGLIGGAVILASASASAGAAPPPALEKAFTHTIVSTYPDGRIAKLWMKPGGTFISEGRRHERHTGRWTVQGEKVCFKRGLFGYCTQIPSGEKAFTTKAVTGETIQVRLEPGRSGENAG
jgi:hypothetical protein